MKNTAHKYVLCTHTHTVSHTHIEQSTHESYREEYENDNKKN